MNSEHLFCLGVPLDYEISSNNLISPPNVSVWRSHLSWRDSFYLLNLSSIVSLIDENRGLWRSFGLKTLIVPCSTDFYLERKLFFLSVLLVKKFTSLHKTNALSLHQIIHSFIHPFVLICDRCNPYFVRCIKPNHHKVYLELVWCVQVCSGVFLFLFNWYIIHSSCVIFVCICRSQECLIWSWSALSYFTLV